MVFKSILNSKISFFEETPAGRIINRFSSDLDQIDDSLPDSVDFFLGAVFQVLATVILICAVFPYFTPILLPVGFLFQYIQIYFRNSSRELKRLESISRSPLFAQISNTLQGLSVIRSFGSQQRFEKRLEDLIDTNNSAAFSFWIANRWLGFRLDALALVVVVCASLFSVLVPVNGNTSFLLFLFSSFLLFFSFLSSFFLSSLL